MRRQSGEKKKRIAEAAVRVFARDGFHGAMISRIADEAGVATGSVYLYFDGKESILQHLFSELWQGLHEVFTQVVEDSGRDAVEKIEALIDGIFSLFSKNPNLAKVFVNEQHHLVRDGTGDFMPFYQEFLAFGEQVFREGVEEGLFKRSVDPLAFTHIVFGSFRQLLNQWARAPKAFALNALQTELKEIVLNGVRS